MSEQFWTQRPELATIRQFALARMTSPYAVLGVVLLRTLATIPPHVVLPPTIGSRASLNALLAIVGTSGEGKGTAAGVADDALDLGQDVFTTALGSGEGIAKTYRHREKGEVIVDRDAVLFQVPEIDTVTALGARTGSTLVSQLKQAYMGERLGFAYANDDKKVILDGHTYRLCLWAGVQPAYAGTILDDHNGGLPQRFLWVPATDPAIVVDVPDEPEPLRLERMPWTRRGEYMTLTIPDIAKQTIRQARAARAAGDGEALDGHKLLTRLKFAQAFTVLAGRATMTDDDWNIAGQLIGLSDRTRARTEAELGSARAAENRNRGHADGYRKVAAQKVVDDDGVKRVSRLIVKRLREKPMSAGHIRRSLSAVQRPYFEGAVEALETAGTIVVDGKNLSLQEAA